MRGELMSVNFYNLIPQISLYLTLRGVYKVWIDEWISTSPQNVNGEMP